MIPAEPSHPPINGMRRPRPKHRLTHWLRSWSSAVTALATMIYAVLTIVLVIAVWRQTNALRTQNERAINPMVVFYTRTIEGQGDFLMIGNVGFGPALNVVTTSPEPLTFGHRILLGTGQDEYVRISQTNEQRATQEGMTKVLNRMSHSVTTCISYMDAVGRKYWTQQRFYLLDSKKDFGIDVMQKVAQTKPCVMP